MAVNIIPVKAFGGKACCDWPFFVFTSTKNFLRTSFKSTVLRSTAIFISSHHFSNFFTPHSFALCFSLKLLA